MKMADLKADARNRFESWSGHYDRSLGQRLLFRPSHEMILKALTPADRRLLDIGCGTGVLAARVLEQFPRIQVWGIDLCEGMVRQCQARRRTAGGRFCPVQADSEFLPFADDAFDVVTCSNSFHHYPRQDRVVAEMHRVLRTGGRLLIIDGDRDRLWGRLLYDVGIVLVEGPVRHLSCRAFVRLYRATGFDEIRQQRRRGLFPFVLTTGCAVKRARAA
jgi:ubiquinone/menaquinone biosynthesis C-methylase UbiE